MSEKFEVRVPSPADREQIGGSHYKDGGDTMQHWNLVVVHKWDYFQAQVIKYVMRWKQKGGVRDLQKAKHFLEKYIEVHGHYFADNAKQGTGEPDRRYVNQEGGNAPEIGIGRDPSSDRNRSR